MALTPWKPCGTATSDATVGTTAWSNPGNVSLDDGSYATAAAIASAQTQFLKGTNFLFSDADFGGAIGQVISLIEWRLKRLCNIAQTTDVDIRVVLAGTIQTLNFSAGTLWANPGPESAVVSAIPGTTCEAVTQAAMTNVGFGVAWSAFTGGAAVLNLDFLECRGTYMPKGASDSLLRTGVS